MRPGLQRVLMTCDSLGGVWPYALDLARVLGQRAIEVVLVSFGRRTSEAQRREVASIPTVTLVESPLKLEWMDDPWEDVDQAGELLLELERKYAPDLVHLNGYTHGVLPFAAPKLVVAHSCVLSWWRAVHGEEPPARYRVYRERVRAGLTAADSVVAVSASMLRALQRNYGDVSGSVIWNGCDAREFWPDIKEPWVLCAGRQWDAAKNVAELDVAASALSWPVYVVGDDQRPPGASGAGAPGTPRALQPLGTLSRRELATWLGRAAIYALPARYEPFGLSVLEAALCGCALVLGDIDSMRELWDGAALFARPGDTAGLRATLARLIEDRQERERLAERARERALGLDLTRTGRAYLTLYEGLLQRADQGRGPAQPMGLLDLR